MPVHTAFGPMSSALGGLEAVLHVAGGCDRIVGVAPDDATAASLSWTMLCKVVCFNTLLKETGWKPGPLVVLEAHRFSPHQLTRLMHESKKVDGRCRVWAGAR